VSNIEFSTSEQEHTMKSAAAPRLFAASLMLAFVFGCQTTQIDSITVAVPAVETPQDEALSKSVRERLIADKKADLGGVTVVSSSGTVYLSGTVKSLEAREQAIKIAWEARGVQSVVNRLEVEK
jgi:osmotically-inducible protein OsmY